VVDDFIDRIMVDPGLNANPLVDETHHSVPPAGFKYRVGSVSMLRPDGRPPPGLALPGGSGPVASRSVCQRRATIKSDLQLRRPVDRPFVRTPHRNLLAGYEEGSPSYGSPRHLATRRLCGRKISDGDYKEREYRDAYTEVFEDALAETSAKHSPLLHYPLQPQVVPQPGSSQIAVTLEQLGMKMRQPQVDLAAIPKQYRQAAEEVSKGEKRTRKRKTEPESDGGPSFNAWAPEPVKIGFSRAYMAVTALSKSKTVL
jgi:hypothetical protein